ncbi:response regulator transcription factor [Paenibacillus sp. GSMTC-2017]|nr:response regulator transcription factor [Paenibacillus sp. GSMTC-2017]
MREETILLIDDEKGILAMLEALLMREGFQRIATATTAHEALQLVERTSFDLIVLDVMLPDMDGFQLCSEIRKHTLAPIIFVTARSGDLDKLMGLGIGGDDYITKPFNPLEVVARINAQLRRRKFDQIKVPVKAQSFDYGYFVLNKTAGQLIINGEDTHCTAKEFELLLFLCEHPNQVFTALQLYEQVWGTALIGDEKTVVIHISRLRKKIESDPTSPKWIVNLRGIGYKFVPLKKVTTYEK